MTEERKPFQEAIVDQLEEGVVGGVGGLIDLGNLLMRAAIPHNHDAISDMYMEAAVNARFAEIPGLGGFLQQVLAAIGEERNKAIVKEEQERAASAS